MNEAEYLIKNHGDRGGCYPSRPKAEADNTLRDLHNSSQDKKAEFNNCFIIHSKQFFRGSATKSGSVVPKIAKPANRIA